jgi:D-alanyl-D-alanine-carboxypeptidase/D-alanyl-D-alanine-endopeptidase
MTDVAKIGTDLSAVVFAIAVTSLSCAHLPAESAAGGISGGNAGPVAATVNAAASQFFSETPQAVGLSIGVIKDAEVHIFNYGTTEKGKLRRPTANTLYPIASITKTFTGTLLALAAVEKRVDLSDDVRKYLDGDYPNLEFEGHPIRLYDLLDHRSGLPFFLPNTPALQPNNPDRTVFWTARVVEQTRNYHREDFFADLHKVKLKGIPGETFSYSNAGAQLMGYILERLYGMPYETLLKKKILRPREMNSTAITLDSEQSERLAKGYDAEGHLAPSIDGQLQGAGALKSSLNDMLTYAQSQMAEGDEEVKLSHKPLFTSGGYSAGLNWQMMRSGSNRLIWQEGNIDGFNSLCLVEPERKVGLVILANEEDPVAMHNLSVMTNRILKGLDESAILLP